MEQGGGATDAAGLAGLKEQAEREAQARAAIAKVAPMFDMIAEVMGKYRDSLVAQGFTREEALVLAQNMQVQLFAQAQAGKK